MSFSKELLEQYAPEARCIPAMKIWKLPDGKENMFAEVASNGKYFAELKKDGYWYQYEKTEHYSYLFSRNVSVSTGILTDKIDNVPHIRAALDVLPKDTIIIGEIYYPGMTSKDTTRIMGCLAEEAQTRQKEMGLIHFYMYDVLFYDGHDLQSYGAWVRYKVMKAIWEKYEFSKYDFLEFPEAIEDNIAEYTAAALDSGEEGVVLKLRSAPYSPDKRPAWSSIKIKKMDSMDCVCIGFCEPTKEYEGKEIESWMYWTDPSGERAEGLYYGQEGFKPVTRGYFHGWKTAIRIGAYDADSHMKEIGTVSSGLTDELKADFSKHPELYLNKVCAIQCMEKNSVDLTLRHGFFKGFRDDKNATDCILAEIFF